MIIQTRNLRIGIAIVALGGAFGSFLEGCCPTCPKCPPVIVNPQPQPEPSSKPNADVCSAQCAVKPIQDTQACITAAKSGDAPPETIKRRVLSCCITFHQSIDPCDGGASENCIEECKSTK